MGYVLVTIGFDDGTGKEYIVVISTSRMKMAQYIFQNLPLQKGEYKNIADLANRLKEKRHSVSLNTTKEWDSYIVKHVELV